MNSVYHYVIRATRWFMNVIEPSSTILLMIENTFICLLNFFLVLVGKKKTDETEMKKKNETRHWWFLCQLVSTDLEKTFDDVIIQSQCLLYCIMYIDRCLSLTIFIFWKGNKMKRKKKRKEKLQPQLESPPLNC